ncbi:MAG: BREX-3 system P-loop-containing protein BrxF [Candidatus Eremiobacterota bacterium]
MDKLDILGGKLSKMIFTSEKLLFITGSSSSCRNNFIKTAEKELNIPSVNLSLSLTERLLTMSVKERVYKLSDVLLEIIPEKSSSIFLTSIEVLFEPSLEVNLFPLLKKLARTCTLIVNWPGEYDGNYLIYGRPEHREYMREKYLSELIISI